MLSNCRHLRQVQVSSPGIQAFPKGCDRKKAGPPMGTFVDSLGARQMYSGWPTNRQWSPESPNNEAHICASGSACSSS